jgi:hypothetical protein
VKQPAYPFQGQVIPQLSLYKPLTDGEAKWAFGVGDSTQARLVVDAHKFEANLLACHIAVPVDHSDPQGIDVHTRSSLSSDVPRCLHSTAVQSAVVQCRDARQAEKGPEALRLFTYPQHIESSATSATRYAPRGEAAIVLISGPAVQEVHQYMAT